MPDDTVSTEHLENVSKPLQKQVESANVPVCFGSYSKIACVQEVQLSASDI